MTQRIIALLKSAIATNLAPETDYRLKSQYACHAIYYAAKDLYGVSWGAYGDEDVQTIKAHIKEYIGGRHDAESYMEDQGIKMEPYEFRKKMLQDILAKYEKKELLQEQIGILKRVKALREAELQDSDYVCDCVRFEVDATYRAKDIICDDIAMYIDRKFSVARWLSKRNGEYYDNTDPLVQQERAIMIDNLIARYTEQLEAA